MKKGFALVGAGLFGERHAQAYSRHPDVRFVSVCDLNGERAKSIAEKYGVESFTTDYTDLLSNPEIEAVSIATPDHLHRLVAVDFAEAGKHILVEKPLATTIEDALAIQEAAEKNGITLMVDLHNRINPPMVSARDAIQSGAIGTPTYVYTRLSNALSVATSMLSWAGQSSALWFLASHMVDVVRWMISDEVKRVYAVSREGILHSKGVQAPDFHVATLEFEKGAVGVFEHAWILPDSHSTVKDLKMEILGSEGAINIDASHNRSLEVYTKEKGRFPDLMAPPTGIHMTGFILDAIAYFVDAITLGTPVLASAQDGVEATRIICAILESVEKGLPVDIER